MVFGLLLLQCITLGISYFQDTCSHQRKMLLDLCGVGARSYSCVRSGQFGFVVIWFVLRPCAEATIWLAAGVCVSGSEQRSHSPSLKQLSWGHTSSVPAV